MNKDVIGEDNNAEEATTLPGPTVYEEELKDYSKAVKDDPIENSPYTNPEPPPGKTRQD